MLGELPTWCWHSAAALAVLATCVLRTLHAPVKHTDDKLDAPDGLVLFVADECLGAWGAEAMLAASRVFVQAGATLVLACRYASSDKNELVRNITKGVGGRPGSATLVHLDSSDPESRAAFSASLASVVGASREKHVGVLIVNPQRWGSSHCVWGEELVASVRVMRSVLPHMAPYRARIVLLCRSGEDPGSVWLEGLAGKMAGDCCPLGHGCFPPRLRTLILHAPAPPKPLQRIMHALEHVLAQQMPGIPQPAGEIEVIASALVRASSLAAPPAGLAIDNAGRPVRLRAQPGAAALQGLGRLPAFTTQEVESSFAEVCAAVGVDVEGWKHLVGSALNDLSTGAESAQQPFILQHPPT